MDLLHLQMKRTDLSIELCFGRPMKFGSVHAEIHRSGLVLMNGASIRKAPAVFGNGFESVKRNVCSNPQMKINRWTLK
jgi:hypothetical protein